LIKILIDYPEAIKSMYMKTKWVDKHAESSWVSDLVKRFFKQKGLCTKEYELKHGNHIVAFAENMPSIPFAAVEFHIDTHDIVVEFLPWGKKERAAASSLMASTLPLLGGGMFVHQDLEKREFMEKVEREFWDFLDRNFSELF
jgi:hypothetical protein